MATKQVFAPNIPNLSLSSIHVLSLPWLDRTIAAVACVPLAYLAYYRYEHWQHGLPLITSALGTLILVGTMVVRRPPKRVTPNLWYWLLAFVATYWQLLVLSFLQQGRPVAPNWATNSIAILGLLVVIWARFSLGPRCFVCCLTSPVSVRLECKAVSGQMAPSGGRASPSDHSTRTQRTHRL